MLVASLVRFQRERFTSKDDIASKMVSALDAMVMTQKTKNAKV